jgi:predicted PurR-regulated permease PerM
MSTHSNHARHFFTLFFALVVLTVAWFLRPYLMVVISALIVGFLFHPMYAWFERQFGGRQWLAVPVSLLSVFLLFVLPLLLAGELVIQVITDFSSRISGGAASTVFSAQHVTEVLNGLLAQVPGTSWQLGVDQVVGWGYELATTLQNWGLSSLQSVGGKIGFIVPVIFITLYITSAVFTHYHRMSEYLHDLSPLDDKIDSLYARRITSMLSSMVRGTLVIATLQGVLTGFFFWIAGVPYAAFFGLLATIVSIIPLGSGVVAIPIGILLILLGQVWQGVFQIVMNVVVVSNLDNFIRPRLVSKDASLHPALTLLGVFAGIAKLGFIGVFLGPMLMILLVTTIEVYRDYFAD